VHTQEHKNKLRVERGMNKTSYKEKRTTSTSIP
ncbi:MAG: hypothetical protein ACI90V_005402, partial [Bacillariaceae sp.]